MRQRDVADSIGCSQATVSRLELGHGAGYSLALWSAAAVAVDQRLHIELLARRPEEPPRVSRTLQAHRTVAAAARQGGWAAETEIERTGPHERVQTVLDRGPERVLVQVWDVVGNVVARLAQFVEDTERLLRTKPAQPVGGLAIVPVSYGNRRRLTEERTMLDEHLPTLAAHWFAALLNPAAPMPQAPGVLWTDRHGLRLVPAHLVPGWAWTAPDRASRALMRRGS